MSIHKSKGLEFPVVFLCGTAKGFNFKDLNDNILMNQDLGFGPKYINYERRIEYNTLAKEALRIKLKTETVSEEMRILYVALTRAREKLYITGVAKDLQKAMKEKEELIEIYNEKKLNVNLIKKYKTYLDWFELVYLNNKEKMKDILQVHEHSYKDINNNVKENIKETVLLDVLKAEVKKQMKDIEEGRTNDGKIEDILNWEYTYKLAEEIPTKTSVSKIKNEKNKGLMQFLKQDDDEIKENAETLNIPKFVKEVQITGAQKGTLVHLCIKNLDETKEYNYEDIKELVERLKNKKIINEKEAQAININTILQYTKSDLFKDLSNAKEVHKEEPFYINFPAREIYNVDIDENVLVQGIIDLYYIAKDGKVVLVDYKTDFVKQENELKEKYKEQLELYKRAIEKALNVNVDKVIIYSTYLQKEIQV